VLLFSILYSSYYHFTFLRSFMHCLPCHGHSSSLFDSHSHCFSLFSQFLLFSYSTDLLSFQGVAQAVKVLSRAVTEAQRKGKEYLNSEELAAQCARALRNLSVNRESNYSIVFTGMYTLLLITLN
jgi:hypothetical protein